MALTWLAVIFFVQMGILTTSSSVAAELLPNGIDFWANDRLHLPDYNACTNLILNPSFEAGFRYWGYLCYAQSIIPLQYSNFQTIDSNEAHSGSHSMRLRALTLRDPLGAGIFPTPVEPNTNYMLSFWAKGSLASSLKLNVWGRGRLTYFMPGTLVIFQVNNQWQQFTIPINQQERFISIYFDAQKSTSGEGCVWLDDIQLEKGSVVTSFKQPPAAVQLVSAARGNFLQFGQDPNLSLIIQSAPNANGTVSISVEDFFFNNVFTATYPFTMDGTGRSTISLADLSSDIHNSNLRGVFIVTGVFNISGVSRPYTDYFRFSVMDFLNNTHKNKDLFNLTYVYQLQSGGPQFARFLERERAIGFGSFTYDFEKFANDLDYGLDSERMQMTEAYGITCVGRPVLSVHDGIGGQISEMDGLYKMINIKTKTNPSSLYLADFESICAIKSQNRPWNNIWWFTGESNPGCEPLESVPDAFAKFLLSTCRGIKQGNPQAKVLIEGGPWNLNPLYGTLWVERYIQDTNRIDPTVQFDGAAAHHYRNFPENPDLDSDIAVFLAMLDRNGHPDWPFYINEGGNYCPFDIPEEGISPYVVHSANSWYMGPLSYHSGRSERISAAFSARNWLVALKYQDRVACMEDFMTPSRYTDVDFTSRFYEKIPNTLGRLLGNASFVRDIVFAPYCRGYLFRDDATGVPIAVIWGYKETVDRWQESSPLYTFYFSGQNIQFIDLMENEVNYQKNCDGRTTIPMSPFPLFIKGMPGTEEQLCNALINYEYGAGTAFPVMGGVLHNGSFASDIAGFWNTTPTAIPYGWTYVAGSPYTTATRFVQAGSTGEGVNNTGELVLADHSYTVSADLGGGADTHPWVRVYATQNINGTGTKVLLASVDRLGLATDGQYDMYHTVGVPGPGTPSNLAGYYVQVRIGGPYSDFGYYISGNYDNIVVTSKFASEPACGDAGHPYPAGDLNADCYVNFEDLYVFVGQWLASGCVTPGWCGGADLNQETNVNLRDFVIFANNWMNCTDPMPPCCCNP